MKMTTTKTIKSTETDKDNGNKNIAGPRARVLSLQLKSSPIGMDLFLASIAVYCTVVVSSPLI